MKDQKIAYIDLSTGNIRYDFIPQTLRYKYLGGRGIGMYLLYNYVPDGCDPLAPENAFIVSAGMLGGTLAPSSGRLDLAAKSPLTGLVGNSNMGGFFSPELRYAGFDHLIITGKSSNPVYLWIEDANIEIRPADHIWGKDTNQTPSIIRDELHDQDIKVMCIGVAGENLVRFANVISGLKNAAGRTGMGCVMGSKNLKAIAVRGVNDLSIASPEEAFKQFNEFVDKIRNNLVFQGISVYGTPMFHESTNIMGRLRNRNFQRNQDPEGEGLYADKLEKYATGMAACFGCPVHCRHRYVIPAGSNTGIYAEGPEWSTLAALGTELDINDMETILVGNDLINRYGIDSLEFGSMVAWAIELYEKGIIDESQTGGLKLHWGDKDLMYQIMHQIAHREGLGDILAEGPVRAIEQFGEPSRYYNLHVKGMSCLHSDERATPAMALGISTSTRGADHLRSRTGVDVATLPSQELQKLFDFQVPKDMHSYEGSGNVVWWHEIIYAISDALGLCKFQPLFMSPSDLDFAHYCQLVKSITDIELLPKEMIEVGERICTIEKMFNFREGASRDDDYPPERYFAEPTPATGSPDFQGKKLDRDMYDEQLLQYYIAHGWDDKGVPTLETLENLGLNGEPSHLL